jgi:hypothetical protein
MTLTLTLTLALLACVLFALAMLGIASPKRFVWGSAGLLFLTIALITAGVLR